MKYLKTYQIFESNITYDDKLIIGDLFLDYIDKYDMVEVDLSYIDSDVDSDVDLPDRFLYELHLAKSKKSYVYLNIKLPSNRRIDKEIKEDMFEFREKLKAHGYNVDTSFTPIDELITFNIKL